jgi:hypothetical protein
MEMPVIPVKRVADKTKNNWKKMEGRGAVEALGVADPPPKTIYPDGTQAHDLLGSLNLLNFGLNRFTLPTPRSKILSREN